jgi:hypothetical protein
VVVEQTVSVNFQLMSASGLDEAFQEDLAIRVRAKDRPSAGAAVHDVVPCARKVCSLGARHVLELAPWSMGQTRRV